MRADALLFALALSVGRPISAKTTDFCSADSDLSYVCGPEKPEDVLAIPGTRWLITSGYSDGAGLKLVDVEQRRFMRWFNGTPAQTEFDRRSYPHCPGPVDPAKFNDRGLSLRKLGKDHWQLLVVNHGGRQSVEVFDVLTGSDTPNLRWRGCIPMPDGQVGNSVASFSDGTVLVTVLTRPGTTIADFVQGRSTGAVWQWRPGDATFMQMTGTELPGNNGLETDPDDRHFYVVAFGWHAVLVYDRADTRKAIERIDAPDFMPDNIHWSEGHLLLAGMRLDEPACGGLRPVVGGIADPMLCHRGWIVGELDRAHHRIATFAYGRPQTGFNGLSAATIAGGSLWLGSFQAGRLAIVRDWHSPAGRQASRETP
ncbi:sugar lactone lactonase YvrE [Sphingomonas vulcanisoli]|uniref:Sugar lactone lactonase YvrE n=1 Tax=Sphingomonas vulcanisoli TaxID=1658060 RepID=A0ABX0TV02_9SPHN|nr:hypothetical protein [Sphingomonas vulcanisoli]NIJ07600.1 sugar lactone lactonase YvrE [Sphingomonas vulcanisoli]